MTTTITATAPAPQPWRQRRWLRLVGLVALTVVPVTAGAVRLHELASGAPVTPANARFFGQPAPIVVHIVCASVFCILGVGQFVPALRGRRSRWHRVVGRVLIPCGLAAAASGVWMAVGYSLPAHDTALLKTMRVLFGSAMASALILSLVAVRRRDFVAHRAWAVRGYAIAMGAGTQVVTTVPWVLLLGEPAGTARAFLMAAGWVINLVVAEAWLRGQGAPAGSPASRSTRTGA